jgi:hypothetical protein
MLPVVGSWHLLVRWGPKIDCTSSPLAPRVVLLCACAGAWSNAISLLYFVYDIFLTLGSTCYYWTAEEDFLFRSILYTLRNIAGSIVRQSQ